MRTFEFIPRGSFVVVCMFLLLSLVVLGFGIDSVIGAPKSQRNETPIADAGDEYVGSEGVAVEFDGSESYDKVLIASLTLF